MFGDIGELSDGDSFDFDHGTDDSDDDYSSDDSSFPETGTTKAVIKSSYASTKAAAKMSNRQIATTVGAAQSQIKHQSLMFSQQMELSQYQHQAKMRVMRNIGINVGKLIDQNNISLKAQMEYSAKSLAFAQDTAAMTKEMRDALWLTVKPKETEEVQKTEKSKAFGRHGFNLKEYFKSVKSNLSSSDIGNMFETVKFGDEMLTMMLDLADGMGSSREKSFKDMLLPMIGTGIIDSLTGENLHKNKERLNKQIAGMPAMLNRMFGSMSEGGDNAITKAFEKIPFLNKHVDKVKSIGSLFHVEDQSRVITNRYSMGNPDEVHPFDNKAHHALTEVIPKFLARIDAGVNHTEEHYFDYKSNALRTVSSIKRSIENEREQVIEYSEGFNEASESSYKTIVEAIKRDINNLKSNDSALLKDGHVDNEKLNKLLKEMY